MFVVYIVNQNLSMYNTRLANNNTKSVPVRLYFNKKGVARRQNVEMAQALYK